jgi:hypothetical protein
MEVSVCIHKLSCLFNPYGKQYLRGWEIESKRDAGGRADTKRKRTLK